MSSQVKQHSEVRSGHRQRHICHHLSCNSGHLPLELTAVLFLQKGVGFLARSLTRSQAGDLAAAHRSGARGALATFFIDSASGSVEISVGYA
jgi:hypothetical protein